MTKKHVLKFCKSGVFTQFFPIIPVLAVLFSGGAHATDMPHEVIESTNTIIWTDPQGNKPIAWAKFDGFYQLREFVLETLLQPVEVNKKQKAGDKTAKLILLSSTEQESYTLTLALDGIWYDSKFYKADQEKVEYFRNFNQQRIHKGDVISQAVAEKIIQHYGVME